MYVLCFISKTQTTLLSILLCTRASFAASMKTYQNTPREEWLQLYPAQATLKTRLLSYSAQVALAGTQIFWTLEVNNAFHRLEEGYENALKDYYKKQIGQLNSLICLLLGNLSKGDRQKVSSKTYIPSILVNSARSSHIMMLHSRSAPSCLATLNVNQQLVPLVSTLLSESVARLAEF